MSEIVRLWNEQKIKHLEVEGAHAPVAQCPTAGDTNAVAPVIKCGPGPSGLLVLTSAISYREQLQKKVTCPAMNFSKSFLVTCWKMRWICSSADVTSTGGPWMRMRLIRWPFSTVILTLNFSCNAFISSTFWQQTTQWHSATFCAISDKIRPMLSIHGNPKWPPFIIAIILPTNSQPAFTIFGTYHYRRFANAEYIVSPPNTVYIIALRCT